MRELRSALRGPRRARVRLLAEVQDHIDDAMRAELERGADPTAAQAIVLEQFGDPAVLASAWNDAQAQRRRSAQRRAVAVIAMLASTAAVLGVAQHADGGREETPSPPRGHESEPPLRKPVHAPLHSH
jgi:hypothetical protein